MLNITIIVLAAILLPVLLHSENKENRKVLVPVKTGLSLLFVLTAVVQPHPILRYYLFILPGLVFCLCGDVLLALPQKKSFLFGLISFLLGHIFYIIGFFYIAQESPWTWVGSVIFLVISGWVYIRLRPNLGSMKVPVLVYVMAITVMISAAWSVLGDFYLTGLGRIMVFVGAVCFYISDVFVARDRFFKKKFINRLIGLPLYYSGQFLLAFSVGFLG
jgi:uncharacterized membrane protein YhhN